MSGPAIYWKCPKCRGLMATDSIHAPHWTVRGGKSVFVDCVGREVTLGT